MNKFIKKRANIPTSYKKNVINSNNKRPYSHTNDINFYTGNETSDDSDEDDKISSSNNNNDDDDEDDEDTNDSNTCDSDDETEINKSKFHFQTIEDCSSSVVNLCDWGYKNDGFEKSFHFPFYIYKKIDYEDWIKLIPLNFSTLFDCKEMAIWFIHAQQNAKKINFPQFVTNSNKNLKIKLNNNHINNIENCNTVNIVFFSNRYQKRTSSFCEWNLNLANTTLKLKSIEKRTQPSPSSSSAAAASSSPHINLKNSNEFLFKCLVLVLFYFVKFFKYNYPNIYIVLNIECYQFGQYWTNLNSFFKYFIEKNITIDNPVNSFYN